MINPVTEPASKVRENETVGDEEEDEVGIGAGSKLKEGDGAENGEYVKEQTIP